MKRRPPLPPPASSTRQTPSGHRPLAFARPPQRAGSASESSFVPSDRAPLRLRVRVEDTPPQRPMPRRQLATPIGSSAPPTRLETASHRPTQGDYQGQSQVRDDRSSPWERSGEWHASRDYPERSRSRQWQDDQQWTERTRTDGTHKKDNIGVQHKDGPPVRLVEILDLNLNGEISRFPVNVIKTGVNNHNLYKVGGKIHSRVINNNGKLLRHSIGLRSSNSNHNSNNRCRLYRHLSIHLGCNQQMYNLLQA